MRKCTSGGTLIENCFHGLKEFRRFATCYDKADASFAAARRLVAAFPCPAMNVYNP
jgi:hypothetical protein